MRQQTKDTEACSQNNTMEEGPKAKVRLVQWYGIVGAGPSILLPKLSNSNGIHQGKKAPG